VPKVAIKVCLHQCKRCGVVYECNIEKCGSPFEQSNCKICLFPSAAAVSKKFRSM